MDTRTAEASRLMDQFHERSSRPSGRAYLWTDAFAVLNDLSLEAVTGDVDHRERASRRIALVHRELGRFRADDRQHRSGWISGLSEDAGALYPTIGGLRIGKPLPEREPAQPFDAALEWDRDGQYFHYLTRWAHALAAMARRTKNATTLVWAAELMQTAHKAFSYGPPQHRRMTWKMSTDLSRPLVPSMGQHDPFDGLVTCLVIEATATLLGVACEPKLDAAKADFAQMFDRDDLGTTDALGLGGLLIDAAWLARTTPDDELVADAMLAAETGIELFLGLPDLRLSCEERLGFRELGLAIGLEAVASLAEDEAAMRKLARSTRHLVTSLERFQPLRREIEDFWRDPDHRKATSWTAHRDINDVMLATSLLPSFARLSIEASSRTASARAPRGLGQPTSGRS